MIRKAIVTAMHSKHPEKINDLAQQMLHLPGTATSFYRLINRQQNSVYVTQLIRDTVMPNECFSNSSTGTSATAAAEVNTMADDDVVRSELGQRFRLG